MMETIGHNSERWGKVGLDLSLLGDLGDIGSAFEGRKLPSKALLSSDLLSTLNILLKTDKMPSTEYSDNAKDEASKQDSVVLVNAPRKRGRPKQTNKPPQSVVKMSYSEEQLFGGKTKAQEFVQIIEQTVEPLREGITLNYVESVYSLMKGDISPIDFVSVVQEILSDFPDVIERFMEFPVVDIENQDRMSLKSKRKKAGRRAFRSLPIDISEKRPSELRYKSQAKEFLSKVDHYLGTVDYERFLDALYSFRAAYRSQNQPEVFAAMRLIKSIFPESEESQELVSELTSIYPAIELLEPENDRRRRKEQPNFPVNPGTGKFSFHPHVPNYFDIDTGNKPMPMFPPPMHLNHYSPHFHFPQQGMRIPLNVDHFFPRFFPMGPGGPLMSNGLGIPGKDFLPVRPDDGRPLPSINHALRPNPGFNHMPPYVSDPHLMMHQDETYKQFRKFDNQDLWNSLLLPRGIPSHDGHFSSSNPSIGVHSRDDKSILSSVEEQQNESSSK